MKSVKSLLILVGTALLLNCGSAMATNRKVFNGSMCQPNNATIANSLFLNWEGAYNSGTGSITVTCPIVRDNTQNTNGTSQAFVKVRSSGSQLLSCTLVSMDEFGNSVALTTDSTTSNAAVSLNVDVNTSTVLGTYAIFCTLPPGGRVNSYDIDEF